MPKAKKTRIGCESCKSDLPSKLYTYPGPGKQEPAFFCEICADSHIGDSYFYPSQYQGQGAILRTIGKIVNILMQQIKGEDYWLITYQWWRGSGDWNFCTEPFKGTLVEWYKKAMEQSERWILLSAHRISKKEYEQAWELGMLTS